MTWKPFSALPNYYGGKRRLVPVIFREIARIYPPRTWPGLTLLDPFMGAGSVSLYAKAQGFNVLANDYAWRCYQIGQGIIENNGRTLTDEDLSLLLREAGGYDHFVENHYVPHTFSPRLARELDLALANIRQEEREEHHDALLYATLIRLMLINRIGGQMTNRAWMTNISTGNFDALTPGQTSTRGGWTQSLAQRLRTLQTYINRAIFAGRAQVFQEDAFAWLPEQQGDIVYLDPPYSGSTAYESTYYHLDCILAGRKLPYSGPSPFNRPATAWNSLCAMFAVVEHIPTWIFSFADQVGAFTAQQLCDLIAQFGRKPRVVPLRHQWSMNMAGDHYDTGAKELLIIAPACLPNR